jgi:hypothetical protein
MKWRLFQIVLARALGKGFLQGLMGMRTLANGGLTGSMGMEC